MDPLRSLLDRALAGDTASLMELVAKLRPVIQARVVRILLHYGVKGAKRTLVHDVDDLVQHVFEGLWADGAKELRAWRPGRGLSLLNYVGLVAERDTISVLRTNASGALAGDEDGVPESALTGGPNIESELVSRDLACRVVAALRADLGPRGAAVFELLFVREQSVEEVCATLHISVDAVYAWRSRISKQARATAAALMSDSPGYQRNAGGELHE